MVSYQLYDTERHEIQTMKELDLMAENTRSLLMYMNYHLLGIDDVNANLAASHIGRCYGVIDILKKLKYYLAKHRQYIPSDLLLKHGIYFDRIWKPNREGLVNEEFQDVVLEIAGWALQHLEKGRSYKDKLPKEAHRALLLAIEADHFLKDLETYNFDIFDEHFTSTPSYIKIPY